jgi:hypothetical protein
MEPFPTAEDTMTLTALRNNARIEWFAVTLVNV